MSEMKKRERMAVRTVRKAIAIVLAEKLKNPTGPTKDEKSVKDGKAN